MALQAAAMLVAAPPAGDFPRQYFKLNIARQGQVTPDTSLLATPAASSCPDFTARCATVSCCSEY